MLVLTLVLVCEYFKVLTALSLAIQTARLWRGEPGRWTAGRLRQLGPPPGVNHCLWNRWTLRRFIRCVTALKTEALLRYFRSVILYLVFRPTTVRLDLSRSICKTITVCNKWCSVIPIYYVSQKWYFWDCDVWHNRRHLDLKIRVLTESELMVFQLRGFYSSANRPFLGQLSLRSTTPCIQIPLGGHVPYSSFFIN